MSIFRASMSVFHLLAFVLAFAVLQFWLVRAFQADGPLWSPFRFLSSRDSFGRRPPRFEPCQQSFPKFGVSWRELA